jgi:hypothetical protein
MATSQVWCDEKAHKVRLLCDNLIEAGSFMCKKDTLVSQLHCQHSLIYEKIMICRREDFYE